MSDWLICTIWVVTLLYAQYIGFEQGYRVGEAKERGKWLMSGWKDKCGDQNAPNEKI